MKIDHLNHHKINVSITVAKIEDIRNLNQVINHQVATKVATNNENTNPMTMNQVEVDDASANAKLN